MWPQKEMMDMRGRPKIDDVRDKLYRVRVNDEEEQMLGYICSAIGIKKSTYSDERWRYTIRTFV